MSNEAKEFGEQALERMKKEYRDTADFLRRERDELKVRMHLASADARDQWEKLENQWGHFQSKAEHLGKATGESAHEIGEASKLVGEELKEGYRRIRNSLR